MKTATVPFEVWSTLSVLLLALSLQGRSRADARATPPVPNPAQATKASTRLLGYGNLPLSFEPNEGQTDASVMYISHGTGYGLFLTRTGAIIAFERRAGNDPFLRRMDAKTRKRFEARKIGRALLRLHQSRNSRIARIEVDGANPNAHLEPLDELPGKSNYFIGNDPSKWRSGIPNYARVRYADIYRGVDLIYYGNQRKLEFDFVVAPGADPHEIALKFKGREHLGIARDGGLQVGSGQDEIRLDRPSIYQLDRGRKHLVTGGFVLLAGGRVGVRVGPYNRKEPLIVDPVLGYSTYLGGSNGADSDGIAVDSNGDAYLVGSTSSADFPIVNGYQSAGPTRFLAFVAELDPTGAHLLYSTYLGGTGETYGQGIALASGNVYVTGYTFATDYPVVNGFQSTNNSPSYGNAFVARIDTAQTGAASLVYSTYVGGGGDGNSPSLGFADFGLGIAADSSGRAYITGVTASDDSVVPFPTTSNAYQSSLASLNGNAFLTIVDTTKAGSSSLVYSTYLGGNGPGTLFGDGGVGIAVDTSGDAYLVGETTSDPFPTTSSAYQSTLNSANGNAFLAEIATQSDPPSLVYSTYFGGSTTNPLGDDGLAVALDSMGKVYVAGDAESPDFPVTTDAFQRTNSVNGTAFVAKFDLTQSGPGSLLYSTFLGGTTGSAGDSASGIAVDANENAFVVGQTSSTDFPTLNAFQGSLNSSGWNAFLTELTPDGAGLRYSTYLGGSSAFGDAATGVALDPQGNAYITGYTQSADFPTTAGAFQTTAVLNPDSGFVAKFALDPVITANISPSPNANGWNNSPVTVTFSCVPGAAPIQSCPPPIVEGNEGANQVNSGTVSDTANNTQTTRVTLNLDMTPPTLTVTSPSEGSIVRSAQITMAGSVSDSLSGVAGVTCNGVQATINELTFSCSIPLVPGANSIGVTATDRAGNGTTTSRTVVFEPLVPFAPHRFRSEPFPREKLARRCDPKVTECM